MAQNQTNQPTTKDNVKKGLELAADIARLKFKLSQAKNKRKNAYTRLGELSYTKYRPRTTDVTEDIENAIAAEVAEITDLTHEIVELELRIKLLKAGA
jgi:transposase